MLDKAMEEYIQSTCYGLLMIKKKSKILLTIQLLIDLYLLTSLFWELASSFYFLPLITLAVIIVKAALTIAKRNFASCIICAVLNMISFVLAVSFKIADYNTTAAFIFAFAIYGLRIKQYILEKKINIFYGYPTFNSFFVINEIKKDDQLCKEVIDEYYSIEKDTLLKREIIKAKMSPVFKGIHFSGAVILTVGIIILCNSLIVSARINNADKISSISGSEAGTYFLGSTDEICGMSDTGMDKKSEDVYWCRFGEEYVTIKVPQQYKKEFAMLYNSFAKDNDIPMYSGYTDISDISEDKVEFCGIIRRADKYDNNIININCFQGETKNVIRDKYIEIVSKDSAENKTNIGIIISFIGAAIYTLTFLFILNQENKS